MKSLFLSALHRQAIKAGAKSIQYEHTLSKVVYERDVQGPRSILFVNSLNILGGSQARLPLQWHSNRNLSRRTRWVQNNWVTKNWSHVLDQNHSSKVRRLPLAEAALEPLRDSDASPHPDLAHYANPCRVMCFTLPIA